MHFRFGPHELVKRDAEAGPEADPQFGFGGGWGRRGWGGGWGGRGFGGGWGGGFGRRGWGGTFMS